jgi:hypothetical protein
LNADVLDHGPKLEPSGAKVKYHWPRLSIINILMFAFILLYC